MFGVVAAEEARVDNDATHDTWESETNDAPVEAWRAASAALPPIHPLTSIAILALNKHRRTGPQQILLGRKEIIIRDEHRPTHALGCKIYKLSKIHSHKRHKKHKMKSFNRTSLQNQFP